MRSAKRDESRRPLIVVMNVPIRKTYAEEGGGDEGDEGKTGKAYLRYRAMNEGGEESRQ